MTILNNENDGLPPELIVLYRTVAYCKNSISRDDLINYCSPVTEKSDADKSSQSKRLKSALSRWENLGLFDCNQGNIQIRPEFFHQKNKLSLDSLTENLPMITRQLLLKEENCLPLWDDTTDSEKGTGTSADFVRAVSWVLSQDIYKFPNVWDKGVEPVETSQVLNKKKIFSSSFRFNAFRFWARYLGFATGDSSSFQIDPTQSIREELFFIFGDQKELAAKDFLSKLSCQLPVLDGGIYRQEIESNLSTTTWRKPDEGHLSMSLSFALRRLDLNGSIKLMGRADTGSSFRLTGHNYRTWIGFESVVWNGRVE